ncbi:MAG: hypothetical protein AB1599_03530 [Planctomycetota bacterium]
MIKKVVKKNLAYWLSKSPSERISAMELLRKQKYGDSGPIQKTVRVITSHTNIYPPRKGHGIICKRALSE